MGVDSEMCIIGARVCTDVGVIDRGFLHLRDGRIAALGPGDPDLGSDAPVIDASGLTALPGFIDLHVHGGAGHDVMDADAEGLRAMARFHARHGVTSLLPTTWAAPEADIRAALEAVSGALGAVEGGATILGAHLEGPWISPARAGAQDLAAIRLPDTDEAARLLDTGVVRLVALAPELPGATEVIRACVGRGVAVAAGHTSAGWDDMAAAVDAGVTLVTHTFNAMAGFGHRDPGTVGAALAQDGLRCELIADGIHVHPAAMAVLARAKGPERVVLVSDAIRAAGLPDGPVDLGGRAATCCDGAVRLSDGRLAGSALTLDVALAHFAAASGWGWNDLWRAVAGNAADALGSKAKGRLAVGSDADVVLLDEDYQVALTVVGGRIVHQRLSR